MLTSPEVPTFIAFSGTLNSRGVSGINLRGSDLGGTTGKSPKGSVRSRQFIMSTVWAMPGGFTSSGREGYQTVESETPIPAANRAPTGNTPSAPGAYQSV